MILIFSYVLFYTYQILNSEQVLLLQFFLKRNNKATCRHIQTDESILAGGWIPPQSHGFICPQESVRIVLPRFSVPSSSTYPTKTKLSYCKFSESSILSCLWALAHADAASPA